MPANAGGVRRPKNNRITTDKSLNTHGIWQKTIGYDPHAEVGGDDVDLKSKTKIQEESEINSSAKG